MFRTLFRVTFSLVFLAGPGIGVDARAQDSPVKPVRVASDVPSLDETERARLNEQLLAINTIVSAIEKEIRAKKPAENKPNLSNVCRPRTGTTNQIKECLRITLAVHDKAITEQIGRAGAGRLSTLVETMPAVGDKQEGTSLVVPDGDGYWALVLSRLVSEKPRETTPKEEALGYFIFLQLLSNELQQTNPGANYISEVNKLASAELQYKLDTQRVFAGITKRIRDSAGSSSANEFLNPLAETLLVQGMLGGSPELAQQLIERSSVVALQRYGTSRADYLYSLYLRVWEVALPGESTFTSKGVRFALNAVTADFANCPPDEATLKRVAELFTRAASGSFKSYTIDSPRRRLSATFYEIAKKSKFTELAAGKETPEMQKANPTFIQIILFSVQGTDFESLIDSELGSLNLSK